MEKRIRLATFVAAVAAAAACGGSYDSSVSTQVTTPTSTARCVSVSTSQLSATVCIQVPHSEASWPRKNSL